MPRRTPVTTSQPYRSYSPTGLMPSPRRRRSTPEVSRGLVATGVFVGILAAATLAACNSHPLQAPNPQPEGQADKFYDVNPIRDLDIVFMIDNSGSMREEQDNLRENFPILIDTLRKIPGGLPNVHIGIISSDVGAGSSLISGNAACNRPGGDKGEFQVKSGCGLDESQGNFIISLNNDTQKNFTGNLEDVFSCMAALGTGGCGFEHQLQSVRVALAESLMPKNTTKNVGFLREDAFLAVVLITDEDDCSGNPDSDLYVDGSFTGQAGSLRCNIAGHTCNGRAPMTSAFQTPLENCTAAPNGGGRLIPVEDIVSYLYALKPNNPERVIVSAITGQPNKRDGATYAFSEVAMNNQTVLDVEPICNSAGGAAAPALRIEQFVKSFGDNGTLDSICSDNFSPALKRIADLIAARLDPGCLSERLMDVDPNQAGVQAECTVVDRVPNTATGIGEDKVLPACSGNNTPCWRLQAPGANGNTCSGSQFRINVDRGGQEPAKGTIQSVKCRTCGRDNDPRCN